MDPEAELLRLRQRHETLERVVDWAFVEARANDPDNQRNFLAKQHLPQEEVDDIFDSVRQFGITGEEVVAAITEAAAERFMSARLLAIRRKLAIQAFSELVEPPAPPAA